jgi:hypothetical protein
MFELIQSKASNRDFQQSRAHPQAFFMHLYKAGGTSVHMAVADSLEEYEICPVREQNFALCVTNLQAETAQLLPYRFVSGHFDIWHARILKAAGFSTFTQLRDPLARIASVYNFLRAHSRARHPRMKDSTPFSRLIIAAKEMPIGQFFQSAICREALVFNNHYVNAFAAPESVIETPIPEHLLDIRKVEAVKNLDMFKTIGFLENQVHLVNKIRGSLLLPQVNKVTPIKKTADEMTWHEWMEPVELVSSQAIKPHVTELISGDQFIYERAKEKFFHPPSEEPGSFASIRLKYLSLT